MLQIRKLDGTAYGYVATALSSGGRVFGMTADPAAALRVLFAAPADGSAFDVTQLGTGSAYPYLGAGLFSTSAATGNLAPGSGSAYTPLVATEHTPAGSPPVTVGDSFGAYGSESGIWTYDLATGLLSPHWVNPNGALPATYILYYTPSNYLMLSGDVAAFNAIFPNSAVQVNLFVV